MGAVRAGYARLLVEHCRTLATFLLAPLEMEGMWLEIL
jgi:hypothetical protein